MSLNGSGVYVVNSSGQPVVANTLITSAAFNAFTADIATALSTAIFKDGQQTVAANIPFSGYKLTGVGAATARTDAATLASIQDGTGVYVATVGGTVDVITLTASPAITAYAAGQMFRFIAAGANTTNVTVNVSGLGAKAITKNGTTALVAADIPSGMMVQITYDGTRFILGTVANDSFIDTKAVVIGSADATKKLRFEVDGFTSGTTRVLTPPDADLTLAAVTAVGDMLYASASGILTRLAIGTTLQKFRVNAGATAPEWYTDASPILPALGANGTIFMARSAATNGIAYVAALTKAIYGFTYANASGDPTNDLDIAAGGAMDATGAYWITTAALTKQLDANWAVGTNQGGFDGTGAISNTDYYIWTIARSDTGVTDYLFSLSSTAPTMPTNYDFKRLIGWFKRAGGTIVAMTTYETEGGGLELLWTVPTLDINLANTLTTSSRSDAVKVPLNFSVIANLNVDFTDAGSGTMAWIYCPDQTSAAPSDTAAPLANIQSDGGSASGQSKQALHIRTSATGTIAAIANVATADLYAVVTLGFRWARRQ